MNKENDNKLKNAIVYICRAFMEYPLNLGSVKLNKILWFSDVTALKDIKETITGEYEYTTQLQGPVLTKIPSIMKDLGKEKLVLSEKHDFIDFEQWIYSIIDGNRTYQMVKSIEAKEREILDEEIGWAKNHNAREVVKRAHSYSWWDKIDDNEIIPVHFGHIQ